MEGVNILNMYLVELTVCKIAGIFFTRVLMNNNMISMTIVEY